MRFLVAGAVLILLGIGLTEYTRRHPSAEAGTDTKKTVKKGPVTFAAPPGMSALIDTSSPDADAPVAPEALRDALAKLTVDTKSADGFSTVMSGDFSARELRGAEHQAVLVVDAHGTSGLVSISKGAPPKVIVARKNVITAVAVESNGSTVVWAEGARIFSTKLDGSGSVTALVQFSKAVVSSLAVKDGLIVAALVPKDGDPFSTDPSGAVVKLESGGGVAFIASEQVRPHDVLLQDDVFFSAGYPSGLVRASADGSFSARIADRADGPLAFDGEGIVHRYPQNNGPEVRRVARAGGNTVTLVHGDVDWLTSSSTGVTRYTTVGIGSRLYEVSAGQDPKELAAIKGTAKGLATVGDSLVLVTTDGDGVTSVRIR